MSNFFDLVDFGCVVKLLNVGVYLFFSYLFKFKMEECVDKCGLFVVICDVLINLDVSKVGLFSIVKLVVSDFEVYMG